MSSYRLERAMTVIGNLNQFCAITNTTLTHHLLEENMECIHCHYLGHYD